MHDLIIRGARLIDGTGADSHVGDLTVDAGVISGIGSLQDASARHTIDADGLALSPGFIDLHAHSDLTLFTEPEHPLKVRQGVTTELLGQDGLSYAPITPDAMPLMRGMVRAINGAPDIAYDWTSVRGYLDRLEAARPAVNTAYLVPHGALRLSVLGMADRVATDAEIERMAGMAAAGMADGAFGLSTGLTYPPAQWSDTREIVGICRAIASAGGIYVTHHRDYGARMAESVDEALAIGEATGVPVHFSHFHVSGTSWKGRAPELLSMLDAARAAGRDVTLDAYPYLAGATFLGAYIPASVQGGSPEEVLARLADPARRPAIEAETDLGPRAFVEVAWSDFAVSGVGSEANRWMEGRRIPDIARQRGVSVGRLVCDVLLEERLDVAILAFAGNEDNVRTIMAHPAYMVGTDAILVGGSIHPRAAGTYPTVLGHYVRDEGVLPLEVAIRAMTGGPAARLGLADRGVLRVGARADLVLFDPATVAGSATYEQPRLAPTGMPWVWVNGVPVVRDGSLTGERPGHVLRRAAVAA